MQHKNTLEKLLDQEIRQVDFTDDRLTIVLKRLSKEKNWCALESDLWSRTVEVYEIELKSIRLDATTVSGHHALEEQGIMQHGFSKDHRPDLPPIEVDGSRS